MSTNIQLKMRRPDDWHVHLRDGAMLRAVLPMTAAVFGRAIVMPNLRIPITTTKLARAYLNEIINALPPGSRFQPLMTAYITDSTDARDIEEGFNEGVFTAAKLYPANATTNSEHGVTDIGNIHPLLETMERIGMPLLVHGEMTAVDVDIFDREKIYIDRVLSPLLERFTQLKVVFEHITTLDAVEFIKDRVEAGARLASTITAHHLHINRSDIFRGGVNPHYYCLPIAKRENHRLALIAAATSGRQAFFLGTDSAPHSVSSKENSCGCAGIFTAPTALGLYAEIFEAAGALDRLEAFASINGPRFYNLPENDDFIMLVKGEAIEPTLLHTSNGESIVPFKPLAGACHWKVEAA